MLLRIILIVKVNQKRKYARYTACYGENMSLIKNVHKVYDSLTNNLKL